MTFHQKLLLIFFLLLLPTMITAQPSEQLEGPIEIRDVNNGRLAWRFIEDRGNQGQNVALWIANETENVRGVVFSLHHGTEAYLEDLHAFCRQEDFALYASLIRWTDFEHVLPDQLTKLAEALGHPETVNVPWAVIGGSRNVGALINFTRLDQKRDQRILAMLFNGGPGPGLNLGDEPVRGQTRPDREIFAGIPMLAVNGERDPYTDYMNWQTQTYPRIRAHNLPYAVAVDWGCGHSRQRADLLYFAFIRETYQHRVPKGHDFRKGPVDLKPFRFEDGLMTGPVDWNAPASGQLSPAVDGPDTVWLPSAEFAALWDKFHIKGQTEEEIIAMWYSDGIPFWREAKRAADLAGQPENMAGIDSAHLPPSSNEQEKAELTARLLKAASSPFMEQREAARQLLTRHAADLEAALQKTLAHPATLDETKELIRSILDANPARP